MDLSTWHETHLSRLMLGTAQFGMPYGVANRTGQPDYADVRAMVRAALEGGVNCFDTAAAYGTSEEVLGRALHDLGVSEDVVVVTKVRPLTVEEAADPARAAAAIEQGVADSRRRLGLDCLPVVLFHHEPEAVYLPVLVGLRARGWLRHAGVSCDHPPGPALRLVREPGVEALQIPANLLDRRHERSGVLALAAASGVAVFLRSVFLQGLLLMPEAAVPAGLRVVLPVRRRLTALAAAAGLTLAELAVRYMLGLKGATCVVIGAETVAQVRENVALCDQGPLPGDLHTAVQAIHPQLPEAALTPYRWPELSEQGAKDERLDV
jgi:aryl-alcohol dehydrogenase-like predicted oxidoreductase